MDDRLRVAFGPGLESWRRELTIAVAANYRVPHEVNPEGGFDLVFDSPQQLWAVATATAQAWREAQTSRAVGAARNGSSS
jgi:hypothetical protein